MTRYNITIFAQNFTSTPYYVYKAVNFPNLQATTTNANLQYKWATWSLDNKKEDLNRNILVLNFLPLQQGILIDQNALLSVIQLLRKI